MEDDVLLAFLVPWVYSEHEPCYYKYSTTLPQAYQHIRCNCMYYIITLTGCSRPEAKSFNYYYDVPGGVGWDPEHILIRLYLSQASHWHPQPMEFELRFTYRKSPTTAECNLTKKRKGWWKKYGGIGGGGAPGPAGLVDDETKQKTWCSCFLP